MHSPRVRVLGRVQVLSQLNVSLLTVPHQIADRLDSVAAWSQRQEHLWQHIASDGGNAFKVAVLGSSVTSGCGAGESTAGLVPSTCHFPQSWSRIFAEDLARHHDRRIDLSVSYKNAVGAEYFAFCSPRHVAADVQLIVIEVGTNLFPGTDFAHLVSSLQRAAPAAAILFLVFPPRLQLASAHRGWLNSSKERVCVTPVDKQVARACEDAGVDAIHMSPVLAWVTDNESCSSRGKSRYGGWYAQQGRDTVHPSPRGHSLVGLVCARIVAAHIARSRRSEGLAIGQRPSVRSNSSSQDVDPVATHTSPQGWEQCFNAAEIPIDSTTAITEW